MATAALIPVAKYLATSYRPDRDYLDGEVRERNLGETPHSGLQAFFALKFLLHRQEWNLRPFTEQRVQITPSRFRIPDVCAIRPEGPPGLILRKAPVVCIEILSREDTLRGPRERIADYVLLGVENIWIVDPIKRESWSAGASGMQALTGEAFEIAGTPVRIALAEVYAELDDIEAGR